MKRSHKTILIIIVLLLAAIVLSGCGGVTVDPETGEQVYNPGIFEPLALPLRQAVIIFNGWLEAIHVTFTWGWAIILVALVIRLLLLPLSLKQMRSMREAQAKTKALQPEIDRLKKKYGKDKQRFQQEQMKLYQEHNITQAQMAGCLPTLIQMPILFAFYYAIIGLAVAGYIDGEPFYWIPDISHPSYRLGMSWLTQDFTLQKLLQPDVWPYLVLPVLLAITQYIMIKTGSTGQPQPTSSDDKGAAAGMMGQMSILMTGMFVFFALQVPAGLSLYWVVGNILALAQQLYVNRQQGRWEQEFSLTPALAAGGAQVSSNGASASDASGGTSETPAKESATPKPAKSSGARRKRRKRR